MKKILAGIVLGIMLIGMVTVAAGDVVMPGEQELNECCVIKHRMLAIPPDIGAVNPGIYGVAGRTCVIGGRDKTDEVIGVSNWAAYCTIDTIYTITDWAFWIMMILAVLMFVIGGGVFVTSAGNPERAARGKQVVIYGIIGLVIALLAKLIPAVARFLIGM